MDKHKKTQEEFAEILYKDTIELRDAITEFIDSSVGESTMARTVIFASIMNKTSEKMLKALFKEYPHTRELVKGVEELIERSFKYKFEKDESRR